MIRNQADRESDLMVRTPNDLSDLHLFEVYDNFPVRRNGVDMRRLMVVGINYQPDPARS